MTTFIHDIDFSVTSERLTELVEVIPRAGPKFRLGMYFDTIHEVPEFDAIKEPEEGYASCWDTDADFDDETGSFLFANLDGDSASVICLDEEEATQLLEKWRSNKHHQQNVQEEQRHTRLPNHKPNPGSDGTYEQVEGDTQYDDHIYESIDDYVDQNQLSLTESGESNSSSPPHTPTRTHTTKIFSVQPRKSSLPLQKSKRSMTIPPAQTDSQAKFTRKYSDCTDYARLQHTTERRHSQPITKADKAFQEPLYSSNYSSHKSTFQKSDYATLSRAGEKSKKGHKVPISIVLKHKGKSYVLPIGQMKTDKPKKQPSAATHHISPKHTINTTTQESHTSSSNLRHSPTAVGPISCSANTLSHSHSMGFSQAYSTIQPVQQRSNGSPQRAEQAAPSGTPKRSKSRGTIHQTNTTTTNTGTQIPTHLTHYGII